MTDLYTDEDLRRAVAAGVLSEGQLHALREFSQRLPSEPAVAASQAETERERLRLVAGFNDVFVVLASLVVGVALAFLAGAGWAWPAVASAAWVMAELFSRQRRMATPSLLYAVVWVVGTAGFVMSLWPERSEGTSSAMWGGLQGAVVPLAGAVAGWVFWWRFRVPLAFASAVLGVVMAFTVPLSVWLGTYAPLQGERGTGFAFGIPTLLAGAAVFFIALKHDLADRLRQDLRSDIAFWLHLGAASLMVQAVFLPLFHPGSGALWPRLAASFSLFALMLWVSLVIDRRALLLSAACYTLGVLLSHAPQLRLEATKPMAILLIGLALLAIAYTWKRLRRLALRPVPKRWAERLAPL